jgi:hypothetical protein
MLDAKTEQVLATVTERLRALFSARLVTVALYGSAVGPDFVAGQSDLNLAVVLDTVGFADLQALQAELGGWRKQGLATPLLLDQRFLHEAADVFPMELEDIRDHHRSLHGADVFATLAIRRDNLRYQCEHEARGKLLRLAGLYLEIGGDRRALQRLMIESLKTFLIVMRNVNRLLSIHEPGVYASVLARFTQHFHCTFPTMARLLRIKLGQEKWRDDGDTTFRSYLAEVQQLIAYIDQLPADGGSTDA